MLGIDECSARGKHADMMFCKPNTAACNVNLVQVEARLLNGVAGKCSARRR